MFARTGCGVRCCSIVHSKMPILAMPLAVRWVEQWSETALNANYEPFLAPAVVNYDPVGTSLE